MRGFTFDLPSEKEARETMNSNISVLKRLEEDELRKIDREKVEREKLEKKYEYNNNGPLFAIVITIIAITIFFCKYSTSGFLSALGSAFIVALILGNIYTLVFLCMKQSNKNKLKSLAKKREHISRSFAQKISLEKERYDTKMREAGKIVLVNEYSQNKHIVNTVDSLTRLFSNIIQGHPRKECNESFTILFKIGVSSEKISYDHIDCYVPFDYYYDSFDFCNKTAIDFNEERVSPLSTLSERKKVAQAVVEGVKTLIEINFPYDYRYGYSKYKPTISASYSADLCHATITYTCKNANYVPLSPLTPWL